MKRVLFWIATLFALNCCAPLPPTVGEEICAVGCANVGAKMLYSIGHRCVCEFEMPHFTPKQSSNDTPARGSSL